MPHAFAHRPRSIRHLAAGVLIALTLAGCGGKAASFEVADVPPAPGYSQTAAWLAFPGRDGLERSVPEGLTPVVEAEAAADVFFIHPTTIADRQGMNGPWDATDEAAPLNPAVLLNQAGVFNGCCRIYAPRYRQATLPGLSNPQAVDLAYQDIVAAFRVFIAEHNDGRPFILASHSQGTIHAVQLLQREIMGTPLQDRLVVAYLIGGYTPDAFPEIGMPICDAPDQTGCVISWNASKIGSATARIIINGKTYWWNGAMKDADQPPAVCVNPLTWRAGSTETAASADLNPGSMPLPHAPFPTAAAPMVPLTPGLTGARCHDGMLEVDLSDAPDTYSDTLTRLAGSYHLNDYGLFYGALRENAVTRVGAWRSAHPAT